MERPQRAGTPRRTRTSRRSLRNTREVRHHFLGTASPSGRAPRLDPRAFPHWFKRRTYRTAFDLHLNYGKRGRRRAELARDSQCIADPVKFKRAHSPYSQTQHVDVPGMKYEKVLHLWLDIIIISCRDNECNSQMIFLKLSRRHHNYSLTHDLRKFDFRENGASEC